MNALSGGDELYAQFLERAPGDAAVMRAVAGDQQIEALWNAANRREFELGAALAEVADDAIESCSTIIEHRGRNDHRVASRLKPIFPPTEHLNPEVDCLGRHHRSWALTKTPRGVAHSSGIGE